MTVPPTAGNPELLLAWEREQDRAALGELHRRGVLSGQPDKPVGQYARYMTVCTRGGRSVNVEPRGHHVVDAGGQRLQVQARHIRGRQPTYYPLNLRPDTRDFEAVVAALYAPDYRLAEAWLIPWGLLTEIAVNSPSAGWRLRVSGGWQGRPEVERIHLYDPQGV